MLGCVGLLLGVSDIFPRSLFLRTALLIWAFWQYFDMLNLIRTLLVKAPNLIKARRVHGVKGELFVFFLNLQLDGLHPDSQRPS